MSLLDISTADEEGTHKCKARELACKSDIDFAAWREKLFHDGVAGIQEWDSMANDYADPGKRRPPKPPATVGHLSNLLVLIKFRRQPYIIVVFEGGPIMPFGLLQELHSRHVLAHIPIFLLDETKDGHRPWVSCCPFCMYSIQSDPAYLNHIISAHYHTNFACGTCLSTVATLGQQMKSTFPSAPGRPLFLRNHHRKVCTVSIHLRKVPIGV